MAEEYRKAKKKSYDDSRQMLDLVDRVHKFSEKRYPFLVGTIVYIIGFIIKRLAFNIKAITREKSGTRTYGLGLVVEAFLLQKILIAGFFKGMFAIFAEPKLFDLRYIWRLITLDKEALHEFWVNYILMSGLFDTIKSINKDNFIELITQIILPFGFGYIFLLSCIGKLIHKAETRAMEYREDSFNSGTSIFSFELDGKKIGNTIISQDYIKTYIEPLIVVLIGFILWRFFNSALGPFLLICVAASFYEDYQVRYKRWAAAQDVIDAEYEAQKLKEQLDNRKDRNAQTGTVITKKKSMPVTFANNDDRDLYHAEMIKRSASGSGVKVN